MNDKNAPIVTKVSISESLRQIKPGMDATYNATEFGSYPCVAGTISRLNKQAGRTEYKISSKDNGVTYTITRQ